MAKDLVSRLLDDHESIRTRFSLLTDAPTDREPLFRQLVAELVRHEAIESIVLHPTVEAYVPDGGQLSAERRAEEQASEERLAELEELDPDTDVFLAAVEALRVEVEEHAHAEERQVFPSLREHAPAMLLEQLGDRYEELKAVAPTHPHPRSGQGLLSNLFGGPVLGMVDRVRDALHRTVDAGEAALASRGTGEDTYEEWTVAQLRERAAELDVEGRSSMNKAELIAALQGHSI